MGGDTITTSEALRIVQLLADGRCPVTGQQIPAQSPYQQPDVVRALHLAVRSLERLERSERRESSRPAERTGRAWNTAEDQNLCEEFAAGKSIAELSQIHQRSQGGIRSRLQKLGKLPL
jgi:secreted protein with Ig-like and vWFA domain